MVFNHFDLKNETDVRNDNFNILYFFLYFKNTVNFLETWSLEPDGSYIFYYYKGGIKNKISITKNQKNLVVYFEVRLICFLDVFYFKPPPFIYFKIENVFTKQLIFEINEFIDNVQSNWCLIFVLNLLNNIVIYLFRYVQKQDDLIEKYQDRIDALDNFNRGNYQINEMGKS